MEILYKCTDKIYLFLKKLKSEYTTNDYTTTYSDIIDEALLSYYNITLEELSKIDINDLDSVSTKDILIDSGLTNSFINYVYVYMDPRKPGDYEFDGLKLNHKPIYIGKGQYERYKEHLKHTNNKCFEKILNELKEQKTLPFIEIVYKNLSNLESYRIENNLIYLMKQHNIDICNETAGSQYKLEINKISKLNLELNELSNILNILNSTKTINGAAKKLNISDRTLYRKMKSHSIEKDIYGIYYVKNLSEI